jgi:hypothetical protein
MQVFCRGGQVDEALLVLHHPLDSYAWSEGQGRKGLGRDGFQVVDALVRNTEDPASIPNS